MLKNNKKLILLYILTILLLAAFNFVFYNYKSILNNSGKKILSNVTYKNMTKKGSYYVTKDNSEIIIDLNDEYIKFFDYKYDASKINDPYFVVKEEFLDKNNKDVVHKKIVYRKESKTIKKDNESINNKNINISSKKINKNVNKIKLKFNNKGIVIKKIYIDNSINFNFYSYIFYCIAFFVIYLFVFKRQFFKNKLHLSFLIISLSVGFLILLFEPPFTALSWDDQVHFRNSYELLNSGNDRYEIINDLEYLKLTYPQFDTITERKVIYKYIDNNKKVVSDSRIKDKLKSNNIAYILPNLLINISIKLSLPIYLTFILGKSIILLIYILVMYNAIKIIPKHKHVFTLLSLIPTSIFISSNYNYDTFVTAFVMLSLSIFVREISTKEKISKKNIALFLIASSIAGFTKATYAPIIFLMTLLPKEKFDNKKNCILFKTFITIFMLIIMLNIFMPELTAKNVGDNGGGDVNVHRQIKMILNNPIWFVKIFSYNVIINFFDRLLGIAAIGNYAYLGVIPYALYYTYLISLFYYSYTDRSEKDYLNIKQKTIILFTNIFIICFIWGALFLEFTEVGKSIIAGVQARYFIPLIFPFILCFSQRKIKKIKEEYYSLLLYLVTSLVLFISIYTNILMQCNFM